MQQNNTDLFLDFANTKPEVIRHTMMCQVIQKNIYKYIYKVYKQLHSLGFGFIFVKKRI